MNPFVQTSTPTGQLIQMFSPSKWFRYRSNRNIYCACIWNVADKHVRCNFFSGGELFQNAVQEASGYSTAPNNNRQPVVNIYIYIYIYIWLSVNVWCCGITTYMYTLGQTPDYQDTNKVIAKDMEKTGRYQTTMMTTSNGQIFRVTGHLCGEFTVPGEFPAQRPETRSFDVFFDLHRNKRLSRQSWGWWFETQWCPLWRQYNAIKHKKNCKTLKILF